MERECVCACFEWRALTRFLFSAIMAETMAAQKSPPTTQTRKSSKNKSDKKVKKEKKDKKTKKEMEIQQQQQQ